MWMFAKSITLTNVILLENDLNFFLSKCGLQKYYIDQCYTFGKHITLFNVILLEKYNNFSHIIFTPICTHYWNANPVTLAILHWKIHTFFPRVETIQTEAEGRVLDCFDSREEGMDFPMWNGKGDGNGIPVMCTNRRKSDVWEIFIFLQKYNIEQCNMFAKSITLINVIFLENL